MHSGCCFSGLQLVLWSLTRASQLPRRRVTKGLASSLWDRANCPELSPIKE